MFDFEVSSQKFKEVCNVLETTKLRRDLTYLADNLENNADIESTIRKYTKIDTILMIIMTMPNRSDYTYTIGKMYCEKANCISTVIKARKAFIHDSPDYDHAYLDSVKNEGEFMALEFNKIYIHQQLKTTVEHRFLALALQHVALYYYEGIPEYIESNRALAVYNQFLAYYLCKIHCDKNNAPDVIYTKLIEMNMERITTLRIYSSISELQLFENEDPISFEKEALNNYEIATRMIRQAKTHTI